MHKLLRFFAALLLTASLAIPLSAGALGVPIGGKVVSMIPCPFGVGYLYTVVGAGIGSGLFWYLPGVPTYLYGPPIIGRWVLGLAVPAAGCGLPTVMIGSSPAI